MLAPRGHNSCNIIIIITIRVILERTMAFHISAAIFREQSTAQDESFMGDHSLHVTSSLSSWNGGGGNL
jgi:hypothetical protein